MLPTQKQLQSLFAISQSELVDFFRPRYDPERKTKRVLYLIGAVLTPITLLGAFWGFKRSYQRHMRPRNMKPDLYPLLPATRAAMVIGGVGVWLFILAIIIAFMIVFKNASGTSSLKTLMAYLIVNFILSLGIVVGFDWWRVEIYNQNRARASAGTARTATAEELAEFSAPRPGIYIGGGRFRFPDQGHLSTYAGSRGGKGANLIVPHLLGLTGFEGSQVVTDVKGELFAITQRYQRSLGRDVVLLDPWSIGTKHGEAGGYNPLDILGQVDPEYLTDETDIIAEMLIPIDSKGKDPFFEDKARALLSGLLVHMALTCEAEERTLTTLWRWLRLPTEKWTDLVSTMSVSENETVQATANELLTLKASEKTYASVISVAHQHTDFLKSPALQRSLAVSTFDVKALSKGNTTLYILIPPDKLKTQPKWLRLVITTTMRAVLRNYNKRVLYILDEAATLGYISEIETALNTYAGYNISIWSIWTSLTALKSVYRDNWEHVLALSAIRQFSTIDDVFTADYVSKMMGQTTYTYFKKSASGISDPHHGSRPLKTLDEIMRDSGEHIYTFIRQNHPAIFTKLPYYEMPILQGRYDENPYHKEKNDTEPSA